MGRVRSRPGTISAQLQQGITVNRRSLPRRVPGWTSAIVLLLILLAACADGDEERRFATDPLPAVAPATPIIFFENAEATPERLGAVASPEVHLVARGAPRRLYFLSGRELWTVGVLTEPARLLFDPGNAEIRALAPSPSADRVALLIASPTGDSGAETASLRLLAADGRELRRVDDLEAALGSVDAGTARVGGLSWSPQGDQLLISFSTGGLIKVPHDGEPTLLVAPKETMAPANAAWSPAGNAVAFTARSDASGATRLMVLPSAGTTTEPLVLPTSTGANDRSVKGTAWLPDGRGLLFAEYPTPGSPVMGGDLLAVEPDGTDLRLVASTGFASPIAEIGTFAVSPEGRAVLHTVVLPSGDDRAGSGSRFHSLWVRKMEGGAAKQLPVPRGAAVTDVWWTAAGIVTRLVPDTGDTRDGYRGGSFALYLHQANGGVIELYAADPDGAATPVASPPASPPAFTDPPRLGQAATPAAN